MFHLNRNNKSHHRNRGIREHRAYSVNLPSQQMVEAADYVGLASGKATDNSKVFETFFGEVENAPLIRACPIAMECRLVEVFDTPTHHVFVGEVAASTSPRSNPCCSAIRWALVSEYRATIIPEGSLKTKFSVQ